MKVTLQRDDLLTCLQRAYGTVQSSNINPILSHILLRVGKKRLTIVATDQEMQMTSFCAVEADGEFSATVPAGRLHNILQQLDADTKINIEFLAKEKKVLFKSGSARFQLQTLEVDDFPLRKPPEKAAKLPKAMGAEKLVEIFKHVHYASAKQSHRMNLNGVLLKIVVDGLQLVATDGHRMAMQLLPGVAAKSELQVILPRKTVTELIRNLNDEETVDISLSERSACFKAKQFEIISNIIDESFPDYDSVIPRKNNRIATIERKPFLACLRRVTVLSEKDATVVFNFAKNSVSMNATNRDSETADDKIAIKYSGEEMEIGFNFTFLLEMLAAVETDVMILSMSEPSGSVLFEPADKELAFKYIVMPIRL